MAVRKSLSIHQNHRWMKSDTESVDVKGVQLHFALTKSDLPNSLRQMDTFLSQFYVEAEKSDLGSWGVIVNSFSELEKDHVALPHWNLCMGMTLGHGVLVHYFCMIKWGEHRLDQMGQTLRGNGPIG